MEIALNIMLPFIALLYGYLFGAIPSSVILGKTIFHQDPRNYGSHNPGGTNSGRIWGRKAGAAVMIIDMLKSIIAFWSMWAILRYTSLYAILSFDSYAISVWLTALGTIIGHCWSIFLLFDGGKGVSAYVGSLGSTSLLQLICGFITFIVSLAKTKYVSFSSILLAISGTVFSWVIYLVYVFESKMLADYFMTFGILPMHYIYPIVVTLMSAIIIYRHKSNIKRLLNDEENKVHLFDKVK